MAGILAVAGLASCDGSGDEVSGPRSSAAGTAEPPIKQAKWDFNVRPTATLGRKLKKKDRRRLMAQRAPLRRAVKEIYDALFLEPSEARGVIGERFAGGASRALLQTRSGVGAKAADVKTLTRRAQIGLQVDGGRRAAARVFIKARAVVDDEKVRVKHRSTLWLVRTDGRWVAIGFQVRQEPLA